VYEAVAGLMQSSTTARSTHIHREAELRLANGKGIATLSVFALAASIALLVRLIQRAQRRKSMRDNAVATLRESGEHFFAPSQVLPMSAPIGRD